MIAKFLRVGNSTLRKERNINQLQQDRHVYVRRDEEQVHQDDQLWIHQHMFSVFVGARLTRLLVPAANRKQQVQVLHLLRWPTHFDSTFYVHKCFVLIAWFQFFMRHRQLETRKPKGRTTKHWFITMYNVQVLQIRFHPHAVWSLLHLPLLMPWFARTLHTHTNTLISIPFRKKQIGPKTCDVMPTI